MYKMTTDVNIALYLFNLVYYVFDRADFHKVALSIETLRQVFMGKEM